MRTSKPSRRPHYIVKWTDPITRAERQQTTGETTKRAADRAAAELALVILREATARAEAAERPQDVSWGDFCASYEAAQVEWSEAAHSSWASTKVWLTRLGAPATLGEIDKGWIARWQAALAGRVGSTNTVATYAGRLKAALRWAEDQDLIARAPKIRVRLHGQARAGAVRLEGFERMLMSVPKVRPADHVYWDRLLRGFWWSDFRLDELRHLSWTEPARLVIDTSQQFPQVKIYQQKNREVQDHPILPEFWDVCCEIPEARRRGRVFRLPNGKGGQMAYKTVQRLIADIGSRAGVITNPKTGKTATAHDLRRGFATRMGEVLSLPALQKWMRHKTPATTTGYYYSADAQQLASLVWPGAEK